MENKHEHFLFNDLRSTVDDLPDEVLEFIFSFLPPYKDLQNCMDVCRRWHCCALNVKRKSSMMLIKAVGEFNVVWKKNCSSDVMAQTITKRFSHAACVLENDMYIFGGCTTNATSFNDLWRFDLSTRKWIRPLATGTYPVPKAYTSMVNYEDCLIVFGGWTYPSLSQYYQNVTMFNEIHFYHVNTNKWVLINALNSPPPMAGHSACIRGNEMIVFGGLVMSAAHNHQVQCSNDVWVLDIVKKSWKKQPTTKPRPSPRYAQSLLNLDSQRLMLLGGVQTLHNRFVYNDCWILIMKGETWTWKELAVKNKEWASANIWCNPACRVGDKVVSLSRSRTTWNSARPLVTSAVRLSGLNRRERAPVSVRVEQSVQRPIDRDHNINGRRGILPRRAVLNNNEEIKKNTTSNNELGLDADQVAPNSNMSELRIPTTSEAGPSGGQSLTNNEQNCSENAAGPSSNLKLCTGSLDKRKDLQNRKHKIKVKGMIVRQLQEANRFKMAAFACEPPSYSPPENELVHQRQLVPQLNLQVPDEQQKPVTKKIKRNTLTMHVLDISTVLNGKSLNYVSWLCPRLGEMQHAPEELVMYSLVKGNGELIMFGGVRNDISVLNNSDQQSMYSNSLHFITTPKDII